MHSGRSCAAVSLQLRGNVVVALCTIVVLPTFICAGQAADMRANEHSLGKTAFIKHTEKLCKGSIFSMSPLY